MLEAALRYADRDWFVIPVSRSKKPLIKTGKGFAAASCEPAVIRAWWGRWPRANIGIVCGIRSRLAVIDLDSVEGLALLQEAIKQRGPLPRTLVASTGRGKHIYYSIDAPLTKFIGGGCDLIGDNGFVIAPPSIHATGRRYEWIDESAPIEPMPEWVRDWFDARRGGNSRPTNTQVFPVSKVTLPNYLKKLQREDRLESQLAGVLNVLPPIADVRAALEVIPNQDVGWDEWNTIGLRVWASTGGSEEGREAFRAWSAKSVKHSDDVCVARWQHYTSHPPDSTGFGALVKAAREAVGEWEAPSRRGRVEEANGHHSGPLALPGAFQVQAEGSGPPELIQLNERYAVVGNVGGKCLVLGWVPSEVDPSVRVPSFQTFKSFSERYANQYLMVKVEKAHEVIEEPKQLGSYWLKWTGRRSYEGITLKPNEEVESNCLNLWSGFAVEPRKGSWELMKRHVREVLACNDISAMKYIVKFAAWAVQHPGERAEVALVFRGGKGSGKGTFANALRRLFGQHGLQIFNSKHLVGSFNGHLRNCLLLFADEAFWAGDKQGESVLKGMLTESVLMIEQKGVDAAQWRNRLHVIMAANAEWVVPASHDERRYAMFDVSDARIGDRAYFDGLHAELANGGLESMLYDLLKVDLTGWHPRQILHNEALRLQKERSLQPIQEWWLEILENGRLPHALRDNPSQASASSLLYHARDRIPSLKNLSPQALGRFLAQAGGSGYHSRDGNLWMFTSVSACRELFEKRFGGWKWLENVQEWG